MKLSILKFVQSPLNDGSSLHKQVSINEALIFSFSTEDCKALSREENPSNLTNSLWASAHSLVIPRNWQSSLDYFVLVVKWLSSITWYSIQSFDSCFHTAVIFQHFQQDWQHIFLQNLLLAIRVVLCDCGNKLPNSPTYSIMRRVQTRNQDEKSSNFVKVWDEWNS